MPSLARCLGHPDQTLPHRTQIMSTNNDKTPTFERVTITPAYAKKLLEGNTAANRNIKPGARKKYERAILNGEWRVTHCPIALDENDNIIDGQHRLAAIANTRPVEVMVARNCDPSTFSVIDIGAKRSAADVLQSCGEKSHTSIIAPAIKFYAQYLYYPKQPWNQGNLTISHDEIVLYFNEKKQSIDLFLPLLQKCYKPSQVFSRTVALTFCLIAEDKGWEVGQIMEFWQAIGTGANLPANSVLLSFRNQLSNRAYKRRGKTPAQYQLNASIKCFNNWKDGKTGKFHSPTNDAMYTLVKRSDFTYPGDEIMAVIPRRR